MVVAFAARELDPYATVTLLLENESIDLEVAKTTFGR